MSTAPRAGTAFISAAMKPSDSEGSAADTVSKRKMISDGAPVSILPISPSSPGLRKWINPPQPSTLLHTDLVAVNQKLKQGTKEFWRGEEVRERERLPPR